MQTIIVPKPGFLRRICSAGKRRQFKTLYFYFCQDSSTAAPRSQRDARSLTAFSYLIHFTSACCRRAKIRSPVLSIDELALHCHTSTNRGIMQKKTIDKLSSSLHRLVDRTVKYHRTLR